MRYRVSRTAKKEYAQKMAEIDRFLEEHGIDRSLSGDSYYFTLHGHRYRVSNHSIEASNARSVSFDGRRLREKYHPDGRDPDTVYIHAGKTRIIQIYSDLEKGYVLDGRGYRKTGI